VAQLSTVAGETRKFRVQVVVACHAQALACHLSSNITDHTVALTSTLIAQEGLGRVCTWRSRPREKHKGAAETRSARDSRAVAMNCSKTSIKPPAPSSPGERFATI